MCCCAIGCQHSTLNRLFGTWFGCVFLVWRHHLRIIGSHFQTFLSTIFLFLTFLNIHIYFIILKAYDQQFTLTTKKSLHIIFKTHFQDNNLLANLSTYQIHLNYSVFITRTLNFHQHKSANNHLIIVSKSNFPLLLFRYQNAKFNQGQN